jgi:hypothetical protein
LPAGIEHGRVQVEKTAENPGKCAEIRPFPRTCDKQVLAHFQHFQDLRYSFAEDRRLFKEVGNTIPIYAGCAANSSY